MQIAKVQAAVKKAPNLRAKVGDLEVIGSASVSGIWYFDYIIRTRRKNGTIRTSCGKRNAEEYLRTLSSDCAINTDISTFVQEPVFKGHDGDGMAEYELPFKL